MVEPAGYGLFANQSCRTIPAFSITYKVMRQMKINARLLLCIVSVTVTACASGSKEPVPVPEPAAPKVVEYSVPPPADYNLEFGLSSDQIDTVLSRANPLPMVRFTIWAYDQIAADVSATKIKVEEFPLRPQSVSYPLRFNREDLQAIEIQSDRQDEVRYYISLDVDVDGDGETCNGDFRQNLEVARPEFFPLTRTDVEQVIEIAEISGEVCN